MTRAGTGWSRSWTTRTSGSTSSVDERRLARWGGAREFYDALAADYHDLFDDWWTAAQEHGRVVAALLAARGVVPPASVLDCTCGIGTQALPLAAAGYRVTGTDPSPRAVARARLEARARGLAVRLAVADVRAVHERVDGRVDAVVSCDNALPHLLTDEDLRAALANVRRCLRDGGVLLVSLRDYDALAASRPAGTPVAVHGAPGSRHASGQAWTWLPDGEHVDITLFVLEEEATGGWRASAGTTRYRALRRTALEAAMRACGFSDVEWLAPAASGYYQPVVVARAG